MTCKFKQITLELEGTMSRWEKMLPIFHKICLHLIFFLSFRLYFTSFKLLHSVETLTSILLEIIIFLIVIINKLLDLKDNNITVCMHEHY